MGRRVTSAATTPDPRIAPKNAGQAPRPYISVCHYRRSAFVICAPVRSRSSRLIECLQGREYFVAIVPFAHFNYFLACGFEPIGWVAGASACYESPTADDDAALACQPSAECHGEVFAVLAYCHPEGGIEVRVATLLPLLRALCYFGCAYLHIEADCLLPKLHNCDMNAAPLIL